MELLIRHAEGNLSNHDREYAAKKFSRLNRFFNKASKIELVHREEKLAHRIEITVFADGYTVRGEEEDQSIPAAIDKLADSLEVRLKKLKSKIISSHRRRGASLPEAYTIEHVEEHHDESVDIRERKTFSLKPMSYEEAALEMEMVGHPFYLFRSEQSGLVELLYKRKDGKYGLLQPEV